MKKFEKSGKIKPLQTSNLTQKNLNIVIIHFPFFSIFGGLEKQTLDLFTGLKNKGRHITFIGQPNEILFEEMKKRNFQTIPLKFPKMASTLKSGIQTLAKIPFSLPKLKSTLKKLHDPNSQNILFCLSLNEKIFATKIAKKLGFKVIWMEHVQIGKWLSKHPFKPLFTKLSKQVQVITPSPQNAKLLQKLGTKNVQVIPNGIDLSKFSSPSKPSPNFSQNHPIKIGMAARLNGTILPPDLFETTAPLPAHFHDKGAEIFIHALSSLSQIHPQVQGFIAGSGPQKTLFESLALTLKSPITFTGFLDDKEFPQFLQHLDFFIVPSSNSDSFSLVAAESLATGTPTLISDFCGISEFVKKGAWIIPGRNPSAISDTLSDLISHPDQIPPKITQAQKLVHQKFSLDQMISSFEDSFSKT